MFREPNETWRECGSGAYIVCRFAPASGVARPDHEKIEVACYRPIFDSTSDKKEALRACSSSESNRHSGFAFRLLAKTSAIPNFPTSQTGGNG